MKKNIYTPIKEHLAVLMNYIMILERKKTKSIEDINGFIGLMDLFKRQCEIYLNYEYLKQGKRNGRSSSL